MFGLAERNTLNCVLEKVPSNRRNELLPIIDKHCLEGTLLLSDGWKAFNKLAEHLKLEDCLHYHVNHSAKYVDPDTGAHTQTIEGLWGHFKDFLPIRGMKSQHLGLNLEWFMWDRNCRQLKSIHPPNYKLELQTCVGSMTRISKPMYNDDDDDFCL